MATLSTYFPATSRRIRRILAVGALALTSSLGIAGLAPDGASATHTDPDVGAPGWGCAYAGVVPTDSDGIPGIRNADGSINQADELARDRAERAVRCLILHYRINAWNRPSLSHKSSLRLAARRHSQSLSRRWDSYYSALSDTNRTHCSWPASTYSSDPLNPCLAPYRPVDRMVAAGYASDANCVGWRENLKYGAGTVTPRLAVEWWIGSGGHLTNLQATDVSEHGVGVYLYNPRVTPIEREMYTYKMARRYC